MKLPPHQASIRCIPQSRKVSLRRTERGSCIWTDFTSSRYLRYLSVFILWCHYLISHLSIPYGVWMDCSTDEVGASSGAHLPPRKHISCREVAQAFFPSSLPEPQLLPLLALAHSAWRWSDLLAPTLSNFTPSISYALITDNTRHLHHLRQPRRIHSLRTRDNLKHTTSLDPSQATRGIV